MNAHIITNENISLVVDNVSYLISRSDALANDIIRAILDKRWDLVKSLADKTKAVTHFTQGAVTIEGNIVKYKGQVIHNVITKRILDFLTEGMPFEPLVKFLENLLQNPSKRAVEETYTFLEHESLPLTEDGCFLAYKAVTTDYMDKHTRTISNQIGNVVKVERNTVDDDARRSCSNGLHVGAIKYVQGFAMGDDKKVIVKVNPKDVVSVPLEDSSKMRVCEYTVVSEYVEDLKAPCYKASKTHEQPKVTDTRLNWTKQQRDSKGRFC